MGRRSGLATAVTLYTLIVVVVTGVLERRDRISCATGDDSCDGINNVNRLVYELAGAFCWLLGIICIALLARRSRKRTTKTPA